MRRGFLTLMILLCLSPAAMAAECDSRAHLQELWLILGPAQRDHIILGWQRLEEVTRPPFPVFRDMALKKICQQRHSLTEK